MSDVSIPPAAATEPSSTGMVAAPAMPPDTPLYAVILGPDHALLDPAATHPLTTCLPKNPDLYRRKAARLWEPSRARGGRRSLLSGPVIQMI